MSVLAANLQYMDGLLGHRGPKDLAVTRRQK
jgi:hypothetical protein